MNRDTFYEMLRRQTLSTNDEVSNLKDIVGKYPYFHAGRMLLIKALHDSRSIEFTQILRESSVHIWDRASLFWLLHSAPKEAPKEQQQIENQTVETEVETQKQAPKIEILDFGVQTEMQDLLETENVTDTDELLSQSAMAFDIESLLSDKIGRPTEKYTFADWIDYIASRETISEQNDNQERQKQHSDLIDRFILQDDEQIKFGQAKEEEVLPTVPVANNDDEEEEDSAEDETFFTETLAKILSKQAETDRQNGDIAKAKEKTAKAINIYKKLSLKFPQKSSYFAVCISNLSDNQ